MTNDMDYDCDSDANSNDTIYNNIILNNDDISLQFDYI